MSGSAPTNYLRTVHEPSSSYSPWLAGVIGAVIAYVLQLVLTGIFAFVGAIAVLTLGLGGHDADSARLIFWVVLGMIAVQSIAALGVARFLRSGGARRPLAAAMAAGFGSLAAGELVNLVHPIVGFVVGTVVEIAVIAIMTKPQLPRRTAW